MFQLEKKSKSPFKQKNKLSNNKAQNITSNENITSLKNSEKHLKAFIIDLQKQFGIT